MASSRRGRLAFGATAAALALPVVASADAETEIEGLVVTARLEETLPQELARYGAELTTVDSQTIRANAYVDVAQVLQMQVPGLFVAPRNGPFSYVDLSLQGSRTGDVLWLVDGVRINNRLYTGTSPADTLPASMIERVEVLKGGQSLFYGTQAVAGAINVVTRGFSETFDGQVTVGGHTNGGVRTDAYVRDTLGVRHRFVLWASKDEASGYRNFDVYQPSATDRRRGYDVVSFGGKYGLDITPDLSLNLYYQHTDAYLEYPNARLTQKAFNDRDEEIASLSMDWRASDAAEFSVKAYWHDWDTVYSTVNNVPGRPGEVDVVYDRAFWGYEDYGVSALAKLRLHRGLEYQLGYDYQNFNGRDDVLLIADQTESVHAFVFQARTTDQLSETARVAAGLRYNRSGAADTVIWNLSGRWDPGPALYLEGMAGTAFLLPSAEQLFGVDPCCAVGNRDLEPEKSLNLNATIGGMMGAVAWRATGFARRVENLIFDAYDRPGFPDGVYVNTDREVRVRGVELQTEARLGADLSAWAAWTWTNAQEKGVDRQFDRIPRRLAKASLAYAPAERPFAVFATVSWVGEVDQPVTGFGRQGYGNYTVFDLAGRLFLDGQARRHQLTARLENAFDEDYATRLNSAAADLSGERFLFRFLGVPRTLHVAYAYSF